MTHPVHLPDDLNMPAFPGAGRKGMTLRDWFAGQVAPTVYADIAAATDCDCEFDYEAMARDAYAVADALMKERIKC